jgi:uncharacterized protein (TIGR03435 family)
MTIRAAACIFLIAGITIIPSGAQSLAFEVATVKVNHSGSGGSNGPRLVKGRLTATNVTLMAMLQTAYQLNSSDQVTGPAWLNSDRFDLDGKSPDGVPDSAFQPMLQALLTERFQLTVRRESRELSAYDLVVAKSGLKIHEFDADHAPVAPPRNGANSMVIGVFTMPQLAGTISSPAGRPVVDKTGLSGKYSVAFTYSPLSAQDSGLTDVFAALEQQLGLKLEPKKEALDTLVVDHAERVPTEN